MRRSRLIVAALAGTLGASMLVGPLAPSATAEAPASCAAKRTPATFRACIATATDAYTRLWRPLLAAHGSTTALPAVSIYTGVPLNPCFDATVGDVVEASFWCDKDETVYVSAPASPYWTRNYAREAKAQGVLAGDARRLHRAQKRLLTGFANQGAATELAHELGHWVQYATGIDAYYLQKSSGTSRLADRYGSAFELSADCMAGWIQGRAAATGSWRNTPVLRWASHATIAELGGDLTGMKPHFRFPQETTVIAHGGAYSRLRMYDAGWALGVSAADGVVGCAQVAADYTRTEPPPLTRTSARR